MKKRILALILCFALVFCAAPGAVFAHTEGNALEEELAKDLKTLGLFQGVSETNFALGRAPTRTEALVMLIRVLGVEGEALKGGYSHPFTDVAPWADDYVGYAYENKLTDGVSADKFGTSDASAAMYLTFVLRALGYSDENNRDFTWSNPYGLAIKAGILPDMVDTENFTRADVVLISYAALGANLKDGGKTLSQKLIEAGVFTEEDYEANIDLAKVGIVSTKDQPEAEPEPVSAEPLNAREIYAKCSDAVFYLEIYDEYGYCISTGSGFFIGSGGIAVTNFHVIDGASSASAILTDGSSHPVEGVYDVNKDYDLALIKVSGTEFPVLSKGDPSGIVAGEDIFAIGSPLGYDNTISQGIISNVKRTMGVVDYIQFTAAISSGSSGGALINEYGQVIGVTAASSIFGEVSQNVNFAVPISLADELSTAELKDFGAAVVVPGAYLELSMTDIILNVGDTVTVNVFQSYDGVSTVTFYPDDDPLIKRSWGAWIDHYNVPLSITGLAPGDTSVILELSDEKGSVMYEAAINVTVKEEAPRPELSFSVLSPSIKAGESVTIMVTHNQEGVVTVKFNLPHDPIVSCKWGKFTDSYTCPLTVTGLSRGRSWIQVILYDEAGKSLCTKNMYVTVE